LVANAEPGAKIDIPGSAPQPDGTARGTLEIAVGKTDESGTHYQGSVNGEPGGEMWVRLTDAGLVKVGEPSGDKVAPVNPPEVILPLPPSLENGAEWTSKTRDGKDRNLQFFGPLPLEGPDGSATGYLIFSEQQIRSGSPDTSAGHGKETIEQHYLPGVGLVKQVNVTRLGGVNSRQSITRVTGVPYRIVANPQLKGRLGHVKCAYPAETKFSETMVAIFKADAKPQDKPLANGYGDTGFDVMPGKYLISINNQRVPVEVRSAHTTIPRCGVLRVHASADTRYRILDREGKTELWSGYGEQEIALPVGSYKLEIAGASETVRIEDGQVVEF
jgi:hypothetical protein